VYVYVHHMREGERKIWCMSACANECVCLFAHDDDDDDEEEEVVLTFCYHFHHYSLLLIV